MKSASIKKEIIACFNKPQGEVSSHQIYHLLENLELAFLWPSETNYDYNKIGERFLNFLNGINLENNITQLDIFIIDNYLYSIKELEDFDDGCDNYNGLKKIVNKLKKCVGDDTKKVCIHGLIETLKIFI